MSFRLTGEFLSILLKFLLYIYKFLPDSLEYFDFIELRVNVP